MNEVVNDSTSTTSGSTTPWASTTTTSLSNRQWRIIVVLTLLLVVVVNLKSGVSLQKQFLYTFTADNIEKTIPVRYNTSASSSPSIANVPNKTRPTAPNIFIEGRTTLYTYKDHNDEDCSLTVALLDPRFPYFESNDTMFTKTLESIADYVPQMACIVLQTSICLWQAHPNSSDTKCLNYRGDVRSVSTTHSQHGYYYDDSDERLIPNRTSVDSDDANEAKILKLAAQQIYARSGPLLQDFWDRGRVRVSILDHSLYDLKSCHEFQSVNSVFLSTHYWMKEFVALHDADLVLVMQHDTVLCKPLDLEPWRRFAYVGSPWFLRFPYLNDQYVRAKFIRIHGKSDANYSKEAWQEYWKRLDPYYTGYYYPDTKHTGSSNCSTMEAQVNNILCPLPEGMPAFPKTLPYRERWVGNGGLSLRSRTAMVRMLRVCPKRSKGDDKNAPRRVGAMQEDMFYSVMLTLVGSDAIPDAQQAAFFSMDQDFGWPTSAAESEVGGNNTTAATTRLSPSDLQKWLGHTAWEQLQKEQKYLGHYLPIGQHKCFQSFKDGGYSCAPNKAYCKYSFNDDNRPVNMLFENGW